MPGMQTSCLKNTLSSTVRRDLVLLVAPESICCTSHCCISNALQTVEGCVCKLVVLHPAIVILTRMLYLHLIFRECTPSDVDFIPRTGVLHFVIAVLSVHAN